MTFRRAWLGALAIAAVVAGSMTGAAASATQPAKMLSESDWRAAIAKAPIPSGGCFTATYPSMAWAVSACAAPPAFAQVPKVGPRPMIVGNGADVTALAPGGGTINTSIGEFDSATVASETGQNGGVGPAVANSYSLQVNTNYFSGSPACAGSGTPGLCTAWEQFIFSNDGTSGVAFIQYWLLHYNAPCAAGWSPYLVGPETYCYRNSPLGAAVPVQSATTLPNQRIAGTSVPTDKVTMFVGMSAYSTLGSDAVSLGATGGWKESEFNVFGNGGGAIANFDSAATMVLRTRIDYGGVLKPICQGHGFTGEKNNLSFATPKPAATPPGPAIRFLQNSVGSGLTNNCDAAQAVGDVHETTVAGLAYDFQARGDYEAAQVGTNFDVQTRHISGAPTWPLASMNSAVATRMGTSQVAVCPGPRLVVDGKPTQITEGSPIVLPTGVNITLAGGRYVITDEDGNSVIATPRFASPNYLDVQVGVGTSPTTVRGLLGNPKNDVNFLEARDGTVFAVPLSFQDLYQKFGDSWRVRPMESMLNVCGSPSDVGNPAKPFGANDLPQETRQRAQATCERNKVIKPWLNACVLDVAVLGEKAAAVYVGMQPPVRDGNAQ